MKNNVTMKILFLGCWLVACQPPGMDEPLPKPKQPLQLQPSALVPTSIENPTSWTPAEQPLCTQDSFCWINPLLQGNAINNMWAEAENKIWAVGDKGTLLRFDGTQWSLLAIPTQEDLLYVWGTDATHLWVVTRLGTVFTYNGAWSKAAEPLTDIWTPFFAEDIVQHNLLCGFSGNDIWLGGRASADPIYHFDGARWSSVPIPENAFRVLDIWHSASGDTWMAGLFVNSVPYNHTVGVLLHYNGTGWDRPVLQEDAKDKNSWFQRVSGQKDNNLWIAGSRGDEAVMYQVNVKNGAKTNQRMPDGLATRAIRDLAVVQDNDAWLVTDTDAQDGTILWHWNGSDWDWVAKDTRLVRIGYAFAKGVWTVHPTRGPERFVQQGTKYQKQSWYSNSLEARRTRVGGSSAQDVWLQAVGEYPLESTTTLYRKQNSSARDEWKESYSFEGELTSLWSSNPKNVWMAGSSSHNKDCVVTHFDGTAWSAWEVRGGDRCTFNSVGGTAADDVWVVGNDNNHGLAFHFDGLRWTPVMLPEKEVISLSAVHAQGKNNIWLLGYVSGETNGLVLHYNGVSWVRFVGSPSCSIVPSSVWSNGEGGAWVSGYQSLLYLSEKEGNIQCRSFPLSAGSTSSTSVIALWGHDDNMWVLDTNSNLFQGTSMSGFGLKKALSGAISLWGAEDQLWVGGHRGMILRGLAK